MRLKRTQGITFIEVVIYIAVLAILSVLAVSTILGMVSLFTKAKMLRRVTLDGETALESMTREVRMASAINDAGSVFNATSSKLALATVKSPTDPTPSSKAFFVSSGRVALQADGGLVNYLVSPSATTTFFSVAKIVTPHTQAVKIVLTVQVGSGANLLARNFYSTIVLRQSYP